MGYKGQILGRFNAAVDTFAEELRREPFTEEERQNFAVDAMSYVSEVFDQFFPEVEVGVYEALGADVPSSVDVEASTTASEVVGNSQEDFVISSPLPIGEANQETVTPLILEDDGSGED